MVFFSYLSIRDSIPLTYNFFTPNHGHNLCDSHTGVVKQKKNREVRQLDKDIGSISQYLDFTQILKNTLNK